MRPVVLGCAVLALVAAVGCSRNPPSADGACSLRQPPAALAVRITAPMPLEAASRAKLALASALDETPDAGPGAPLFGKTVLHIGDSMVGGNQGLTKALEQRFTAEGAKFVRDYKVSESIVSCDKSPKLKDLLAKYQPDIVLVTLGANDVFVPYPAVIASHVRSIVARIGARECYWMGPPTWKPDTGIVQVIHDNAAPCKFYDASNLKLQRAGDGIHPTDRGGADWATAFWTSFRPGAMGVSGLVTDGSAP